MKDISNKKKGILNPNNKVTFFGVNFLYLQILFGAFREKRIVELLWGAFCFVKYRPFPVCDYSVNIDDVEYESFITVLIDGVSFYCRSFSSSGSQKVYAEYGEPGAHLIFVKGVQRLIYDPYKYDNSVYHIHNVINISGDRYFLSTGDSCKYLDEFIVNAESCSFVRRHIRYLGGFTSSIKLGGRFYFGTDFSFRPNYIFEFDSGAKYFLPKQAWLEHIIDMRCVGDFFIVLITKLLNSNHGHRLIFCTKRSIFISAARVSIIRQELYETI